MDTKKLQYAGILALSFAVLSSPQVYKLTDNLGAYFGLRTANSAGTPTNAGLVLHGLVIGVIIYALLAQNYIIAASRPIL